MGRMKWGSAILKTLLSSISGSKSGNPISHLDSSLKPNTHSLPINFLIGFKSRAWKVQERLSRGSTEAMVKHTYLHYVLRTCSIYTFLSTNFSVYRTKVIKSSYTHFLSFWPSLKSLTTLQLSKDRVGCWGQERKESWPIKKQRSRKLRAQDRSRRKLI